MAVYKFVCVCVCGCACARVSLYLWLYEYGVSNIADGVVATISESVNNAKKTTKR